MVPRSRHARGRRSWGRKLARVLLPALAAAVVLGFVVGSMAQVGRESGPFRQTVDRGFAVLAGTVALESDATAASLSSLLARAPVLERTSLFSGLDQAAADTARQAQRLDSAVPPAPASADSGCMDAMRARVTATEVVRRDVEGLLGGPSGGPAFDAASAVAALDRAADTLAGSDADWAACRRALRASPGHPLLASSRWLSSPAAWVPPALGALVAGVEASPTLAAQPALTITAVDTDPGMLPGTSSAEVFPTTQLDVHVVVSDTGNVDEAAVQVRAVLVGGGGPGLGPLSSIVALRAGRSATVVLGPFTVAPGGGYTLQVTAATPTGVGTAVMSSALAVAPAPPASTTTSTVPSTVASTRRSALQAPPPV